MLVVTCEHVKCGNVRIDMCHRLPIGVKKWIEKSVRIFNNLLHFTCSEKERSQFDCLEDTILEVCLWEFKLWLKHAVVTWVLLLSCRCVRNANYDEALDLEAFVSKLATMHSRWLEEHSFWCAPNHMWDVCCSNPLSLPQVFSWNSSGVGADFL